MARYHMTHMIKQNKGPQTESEKEENVSTHSNKSSTGCEDSLCKDIFQVQSLFLRSQEEVNRLFIKSWEYSSVVDCFPNMWEVLGLISSTTKKKKRLQETAYPNSIYNIKKNKILKYILFKRSIALHLFRLPPVLKGFGLTNWEPPKSCISVMAGISPWIF
jgi:hypothetical protein